jgi:hypothetical protein
MTTDYRVVDLGTKLGSALTEFRRRADQFFPDLPKLPPGECLGVDRNEKYRADVEGQGYLFAGWDLTDSDVLTGLPTADYYIAWDFLEHLPDTLWSQTLVKLMLHNARRGVWLRLPSFEQDAQTGEGRLKELGLRFAWTEWTGHKSRFTLMDCAAAIQEYSLETGRSVKTKFKPGRRVRSTADSRVVPLAAPVDTVKYTAALGLKPVQQLEPPLVAQWEVLLTYEQTT